MDPTPSWNWIWKRPEISVRISTQPRGDPNLTPPCLFLSLGSQVSSRKRETRGSWLAIAVFFGKFKQVRNSHCINSTASLKPSLFFVLFPIRSSFKLYFLLIPEKPNSRPGKFSWVLFIFALSFILMGCTGSSRAKGDGKHMNLFTSYFGISLLSLKQILFSFFFFLVCIWCLNWYGGLIVLIFDG